MAKKPETRVISCDDPLPKTPRALADDIRTLAAARAKAALDHVWNCKCDPCKIRKREERASRHAIEKIEKQLGIN